MLRTFRAGRSFAVVAFALVAVGVFPQGVAAGARPWLQVIPNRVPIGGRATIVGSHLGSGRFVTLLLYVRTGGKPFERFLGVARADGAGNVRAQVRMPLTTHCGAAAVYGLASRSSVTATASFTFTGCKAGSGVVPPPPPPGGATGKKKP